MVFGRGREARQPIRSTHATRRMGMVGFTWMNSPNRLVPKMAPSLAKRRCTPIAVDLHDIKDENNILTALQ